MSGRCVQLFVFVSSREVIFSLSTISIIALPPFPVRDIPVSDFFLNCMAENEGIWKLDCVRDLDRLA